MWVRPLAGEPAPGDPRGVRNQVAIGLVGLVNVFDSELVVVSEGSWTSATCCSIRCAPRSPATSRGGTDPWSRSCRRRSAAARDGQRGSAGGRWWNGASRSRCRRSADCGAGGGRRPGGPRRASAVFAYDHLFRRTADGSRRPALEMFALPARSPRTSQVALGSLVARATCARRRRSRTDSTPSLASPAPSGSWRRSAPAAQPQRSGERELRPAVRHRGRRVGALRGGGDDT